MSKIRIAIAEDDRILREVFSNMLTKNGTFEVLIQAKDGVELISLLESKTEIDIITMDIMMPHMDGFTATEIIKERWPLIKIIGLSARTMKDDIIQFKKLGAEGYILKPFDPKILIDALKDIYIGKQFFQKDD